MQEVFSVRCSGCGASVVYEPTSKQLRCPQCGCQSEIPSSFEEIREIDLQTVLNAALNQQEAIPEHTVLSCGSCGAQIAYKGARATCDFCGSEAVRAAALQSLPVRPQAIVPFGITQQAAWEIFQRWFRSLWFVPPDLSRRARVEELRGVYLPIWTFDAQVWAHWRAEFIKGFFVIEKKGHHKDFFDDLPVVGFRSLPPHYVYEIGGFDLTTDLRPYDPAYFLGWDVALPEKSLVEAWQEAYECIYKVTTQACRRSISDSIDDDEFSMELQLSGLTTKLVYVPIYILAYRYKGKPYRVVIHGRSGAIIGDRPSSRIKILWTVLLMGIVIILAGLLLLPLIIFFIRSL